VYNNCYISQSQKHGQNNRHLLDCVASFQAMRKLWHWRRTWSPAVGCRWTEFSTCQSHTSPNSSATTPASSKLHTFQQSTERQHS